MIFRTSQIKQLVTVASTTVILAACASDPIVSEDAIAARASLTSLQADGNLASLARVEIMDADQAVTAAERPTHDKQLTEHLVLMADSKVEIARSWAQSRFYESQRDTLNAEAEAVRLNARTLEADSARRDASSARRETGAAQATAARALRETETAQARTQTARDDASVARADAAAARSQTDLARAATDEAMVESAALQQQVAELNARVTDRGLVMTLGDIMFETGKYELRSGTTSNLDTLSAFLSRYEDRSVVVEGHTDSTGSADSNLILSRLRAESVTDYLIAQGIESSRLTSTSMGEGSPVASNDTSTGRQQNRRVEVIISNEPAQPL